MNRPFAILFFLFIAMSCSSTSCKRKETIETKFSRLVNTWKLIKTGTDDNGNGAVDASEIHLVQEGLDDELVFTKEYTGKETVIINGVTTEYPFTWKKDDNDTLTRDGIGHNTIKYHIDVISSVSLQLSTNTTLGNAAYIYNKK